jgi:hypothetical protein
MFKVRASLYLKKTSRGKITNNKNVRKGENKIKYTKRAGVYFLII